MTRGLKWGGPESWVGIDNVTAHLGVAKDRFIDGLVNKGSLLTVWDGSFI